MYREQSFSQETMPPTDATRVIQHMQELLIPHFLGSVHDAEETQKRLNAQAAYLEKKYPNYRDFLLYHELVGSTPKEEKKLFDFPGDDSVVTFFEHLPPPEPIN